jgi:hypothetical protein
MSRPTRVLEGRLAAQGWDPRESPSIYGMLEAEAERIPEAVATLGPGRIPVTYRHLVEQIRYLTVLP